MAWSDAARAAALEARRAHAWSDAARAAALEARRAHSQSKTMWKNSARNYAKNAGFGPSDTVAWGHIRKDVTPAYRKSIAKKLRLARAGKLKGRSMYLAASDAARSTAYRNQFYRNKNAIPPQSGWKR